MNMDPTVIQMVKYLDRLASLVERMAATTPDERDKKTARKLAVDISKFTEPYFYWEQRLAPGPPR